MAEIDAGVLPVEADDRLVGMVTDRDIAVRGIAAGKEPDTQVRDVMRCCTASTIRSSSTS